MIGIYCIRHRESGKCYIGQSVNIKHRFGRHLRRTTPTGCRHLENAIKKYGVDAFDVEILELCSEENLDARECHWISALDTMNPNGYNLKSGGSHGRHSEESKRLMAIANTGKKHSDETKRLISRISSSRRHTEASKKKMSEVQTGREGLKGADNPAYRHDLWEQSETIYQLYLRYGNYTKLGKMFGCDKATIKSIVNAHTKKIPEQQHFFED